ncbi:nitroreductase family protein [Pseudomonas sp. TH10]|uniref:nitroreductase family protein n=1 Tax=Pseudomonas sp. TH10 TaxID=2796376 RepID=UPI00237AA64E
MPHAAASEPFSQQLCHHEEIEAILDIARFSASGVNMQPWRVHVVTGDAKDRLSTAIAAIDNDPQLSSDMQEPYKYYPREWSHSLR